MLNTCTVTIFVPFKPLKTMENSESGPIFKPCNRVKANSSFSCLQYVLIYLKDVTAKTVVLFLMLLFLGSKTMVDHKTLSSFSVNLFAYQWSGLTFLLYNSTPPATVASITKMFSK